MVHHHRGIGVVQLVLEIAFAIAALAGWRGGGATAAHHIHRSYYWLQRGCHPRVRHVEIRIRGDRVVNPQ